MMKAHALLFLAIAGATASTASTAQVIYDDYDGPKTGPGKTHIPIGRLQHTHKLAFDFDKDNVKWWAFTCPASEDGSPKMPMKALAGGAYVDPPDSDASRRITLHSTKIAIKDDKGLGAPWPPDKVRIEVRRVPTAKEIGDLAAGRKVPPITVDVTFWATCID